MINKDKLQNIIITCWIGTGILYGVTDSAIFMGMSAMCFIVGIVIMVME